MTMIRSALIALALLAPTASFAQHPSIAVGGNGIYPLSLTGEHAAICQHVLQQYPADHLVIEAHDILIDCNRSSPMSPVHIRFRSVADMLWYFSHQGRRIILQGEGPGD